MHRDNFINQALTHTFTLAIRYSDGRGKVTAVLAMKAILRAEL
jgi:hypothetical protein